MDGSTGYSLEEADPSLKEKADASFEKEKEQEPEEKDKKGKDQ